MQEALQLIIYCLLTVFLVLLLAGCAKCCLRGFCPTRFRRSEDRRPSDVQWRKWCDSSLEDGPKRAHAFCKEAREQPEDVSKVWVEELNYIEGGWVKVGVVVVVV